VYREESSVLATIELYLELNTVQALSQIPSHRHHHNRNTHRCYVLLGYFVDYREIAKALNYPQYDDDYRDDKQFYSFGI
jgi:hypothetical protein